MTNSGEDDKFERLVESYETISIETDESQRRPRLLNLINAIKALTDRSSRNGDAFHLLGLCHYHLPNGSSTETDEAETAFRTCLSIEPGYQYANVYLGYLLFDTRRYGEALERFRRLDPKYFTDRLHQWRVVKNEELMLCCRLMTTPGQTTVEEIDAICSQYEHDPNDELAVPRDLVLCLDEIMSKNTRPPPFAFEFVRRVLTMLKPTDNMKVRYLESAILRLSQVKADESRG